MKPEKSQTASLAVISLDICKEVFHLVGFSVDGEIAFRKLERDRLAQAESGSERMWMFWNCTLPV